MYVRNIVMKDIVYEAIVIDMFYEQVPPEPVSERTPIIRGYVSKTLYVKELDRLSD